MLYRPPPTPTSTARRVTGQFLARNRLPKKARARLAADIIDGKVMVTDFTTKQIAALCGVSVPYINAVHQPDRATAKLLRDWAAATDTERVEFARRAGAENIFDVIAQVA